MSLDLLFLLLFIIWYERRFLPLVAAPSNSAPPPPQAPITALSKDIKKHMFALISENNKLRAENQNLHKQLAKTEVVETLYQHFDVNVEKSSCEKPQPLPQSNPLIKSAPLTTIQKSKPEPKMMPNLESDSKQKDVLSQVITYGPPSTRSDSVGTSSPDDEDMFQNFFVPKKTAANENDEATFM